MKTKKQLSARTIRLLRQVQAIIRLKPKRYNQNNDSYKEPTCKSPACIIGWARFFNLGRKTSVEQLLPGALYYRLYYPTEWPKQFFETGTRWQDIKASTAVKRIEHFIKTDGRE